MGILQNTQFLKNIIKLNKDFSRNIKSLKKHNQNQESRLDFYSRKTQFLINPKSLTKNKKGLKKITSQTPLTRYPKKNPEEQIRNCCHLGRSDKEIPNRDLDCSSLFFIFL